MTDANSHLDRSIKEANGLPYEGTDPIKDEQSILVDKFRDLLNHRRRKGKKQVETNPFNTFGHGIVEYFRLMKILMNVFVGIILLFAPVMWIYSSGGEFEHFGEAAFEVRYTLGNLGQMRARKFHQYLLLDQDQEYHCSNGVLSDVIYVGLIPERTEKTTFQNDYCGDPQDVPEISNCTTKYLDHAGLKESFEKNCTG